MEIVNPLGPIGLEDTNGWEIPCSGLVEFSVELAEKSCNVIAWVSQHYGTRNNISRPRILRD